MTTPREILPRRESPVLAPVEENQIAQAARDYLAAGWQPIPVPLFSKSPDDRTGWQKERWTLIDVPQRFPANSNIGLLLGDVSNGLVDLDLDCPEAIALAPMLAPATGFKSGRKSAPRSHCWYIGTPVPEHRKLEFDGKILELRTIGQTVVPPSMHPTGEQYEWQECDGVPPTIAGAELSRIAAELAAAVLIVRHYPKTGSRHGFALALSGFLQRRGWPFDHVRQFVTAIATAAGDDEIDDRLKAIGTTAQKLVTDEPTTGGPALREMLGNAVFEKFCEWLGFTKSARFALPTIEADRVEPEIVPFWPEDTLEGDFLSDLTYQLYTGTRIPPQFLREQIVLILAALADGLIGFPRQARLPLRRYLALISELPQSCKGESWKRLTTFEAGYGALRPVIDNAGLHLQDGSGIGSGQYLAHALEEHPRMICHWDESSQLFQVAGQQNSTLLSALKTLFESNSYHSGSVTHKAHGTDDAHLTVLLHSTRSMFLDGFAQRGGIRDGLLSRFTLVYSAGMPAVREWPEREWATERNLVEQIERLIPRSRMVPGITPDAHERFLEFAGAIYAPTHPHRDYTPRLREHVIIDILHRCVYSGSQEITLEMVQRGIAWGEHQLALRLAFWPPDAKGDVAAMTQLLLARLRKGSASTRDLRTAAHVYRDGTHELFARCLSGLRKSGEVIILGKNSKNQEVYGFADPEVLP
jgi:hypothetical protein